jgi:hypothetical protein
MKKLKREELKRKRGRNLDQSDESAGWAGGCTSFGENGRILFRARKQKNYKDQNETMSIESNM